MGKSARIIGREEFGLGDRAMNRLLLKHGYLYGEPGAYGVTEKGAQFGAERSHDNGYGGSAYRQWETITWNDGLADALRADIAANPDGLGGVVVAADEDVAVDEGVEDDDYEYEYESPGEDEDLPLSGKEAAVLGAALVAGVLLWKFGPPLWRNHIKPAAVKGRRRLATRRSAADGAVVESEVREVRDGGSSPV